MNNERLADTMDINVDMAKRAVGSLFDDTRPLEEEQEEEIVSGYGKPFKQRINADGERIDRSFLREDELDDDMDNEHFDESNENEIFEENDEIDEIDENLEPSEDEIDTDDELRWPEDEFTGGYIPRRAAPPGRIPPPKPALKANPSVPAASRTPLRPKKNQSLEDFEEEEKLSAPPKARALRDRYILADEDVDDEYSAFRRRYTEREKKKPMERNPEDVPEMRRKLAAASNDRKVKPPREENPQERKPRRRVREDAQPSPSEEYVSLGLPAPIRWVIIACTVMLLCMMAFLVYRNSVLGTQLSEANELAQQVAALELDLTRARIDLEAVRGDLAAAEAENIRLSAIAPGVPIGSTTAPADTEDAYGYDTPYSDTAEPAAPAARVHIVVPGDSLSRISRNFFGNDSYANIQRIMVANNLTDPDNIAIGMPLTIPE